MNFSIEYSKRGVFVSGLDNFSALLLSSPSRASTATQQPASAMAAMWHESNSKP
jgi:hypothetical protein